MGERRDHDLVLVGATGFTGGLTAEYLARNAPEDCRWALAGRSVEKLAGVRARLTRISPRLADQPLLRVDLADRADVARVARSARLVVSTVGPYLEHGEPLVAACAEAGTDYADLTGEPEFVDRMYLRHHERAVASGARLVHACGFDSVPHDLGARFTVLQLPEGVPLTVTARVRAGGALSGGTFHSAVTAISRRTQMRQASTERRAAEPRPPGRRVRLAARAHRADGHWMVPLPTIDPLVVRRSAAALDRYGPAFEYGHYAGVRSLRMLAVGAAGLTAVSLAAQVPRLRSALLGRVRQGDGPNAQRRARSWFTVRFVGSGGGRRVVTEVAGGDPGYEETAKMLGESALSLAFDDNPRTSGQVTTAVAMGERLTERLVRAGITFEVLEDGLAR